MGWNKHNVSMREVLDPDQCEVMMGFLHLFSRAKAINEGVRAEDIMKWWRYNVSGVKRDNERRIEVEYQ